MESILFSELTVNEQETLQGGSGYYERNSGVTNNVVSGASASASQGQAQGQAAQQQGLLSFLGL